MTNRGNSMGPHVGNRPPCMVLAANGAATPDCRRAHRLPASRCGTGRQETTLIAESVADHAGRDRFALGYNPAERLIRPMRKGKMISVAMAAEDRIAGCS
jgi:hypothetical protein